MRVMSASISAESVEFWSGSFFISDGADSTRRVALGRERAEIFYLFQAWPPQAHASLDRWRPAPGKDGLLRLLHGLLVCLLQPSAQLNRQASEMFGRHLVWPNRVEGKYEYRKNT